MVVTPGAPVREVAAGSLTHPAAAARTLAAAAPPADTLVAAALTAGVLLLVFAVLCEWLTAGMGPDPEPRRSPMRLLVALAVSLLGGGAGLQLVVGG
jgi:hypothetical protein